jgi:protein-S-isoprenylcysteine O-methyltransferase Ste14
VSVVKDFVGVAIPAMWIAWVVYWLVAAINVKRTRWRQPVGAESLHGIPLLLCIVLWLAPRWEPAALTAQMLPRGPVLELIGTAIVAAGIGYASWARVHLGRNWSSKVVVKEDHSLIRTGPYRLVRHPIYTGMLLALFGSALAVAEWRGFLALLFALIGVLFRVHAEETRMTQTFPEYTDYKRHSSTLVPGVF